MTRGLPGTRLARYDSHVEKSRNRRIWHAEADRLCDMLDEAGAWQTAVRLRVARARALDHRPEGSAFDYRPAPDDTPPLDAALGVLRHPRLERLRRVE